MGDIVNAVADVFGFGPASKQEDAANRATDISAQTTREALDLQRRMYEEGAARQQPWLQTGQNALARMQGGEYALPPAFTGQVNLGQDPGYAFRLSEGMKALERGAAARGGLLSGATLKGAQRYGQDLASQEYQNAYGRALDVYNSQLGRANTGYNRLAALAGIGQTTAGTLGAAGSNYANQANQLATTNAANQGNLALATGNIRASQYGGYGSALNQALNTNWGQVGNYLGNPLTAWRYGTNPGSQQTNTLAAQEAGM